MKTRAKQVQSFQLFKANPARIGRDKGNRRGSELRKREVCPFNLVQAPARFSSTRLISVQVRFRSGRTGSKPWGLPPVGQP